LGGKSNSNKRDSDKRGGGTSGKKLSSSKRHVSQSPEHRGSSGKSGKSGKDSSSARGKDLKLERDKFGFYTNGMNAGKKSALGLFVFCFVFFECWAFIHSS
jgi:hypothetical protein